jgi:hypothetical protein
MAETKLTVKELVDRLRSEGLVNEAGAARVAAYLLDQEKKPADPLYIKLLSGFGAWLAAPFLFAFLVLFHVIGHDPAALLATGVISLVAALVLNRIFKNIFLAQFGLALSFAGHLLVLYSQDSSLNLNHFGELAVTQLVLCILIYPFFRNAAYRFLMPLFAVALGLTWVYATKHYSALSFFVALQALCCGALVLLAKKPSALNPLQYVFAVGSAATILLMTFTGIFIFKHPVTPSWPSSAVLAAGLIMVLLNLGGGIKSLKKEWMILALAITGLLGVFTTPGLLVALGLLVLGYGMADQILTGIALLFLPVFLVLFYYDMDVSLLNKSYILAGSGLCLLMVRWALKQRSWARELSR